MASSTPEKSCGGLRKTAVLLATLAFGWASAPGREAWCSQGPGLEVPRNYRAVALPLDGAMASALGVEHRIDILLDAAELSSKRITRDESPQGFKVRGGKLAFLTNVLVLDVRKSSKDIPFATVQVALNPMETQYLALAMARNLKISVEKSRPSR